MDVITGPELAILAAAAASVSAILQDLKPFLKRLSIFQSDDAPWGLLVKISDIFVTIILWLGDALPSVENIFGAFGVGIAAAFTSQKVYDEVKKPKPEEETKPPLPHTIEEED